MDDLHAVVMAGPLGPYARGFAAELARLGFTRLSAQKQMGLAAHLSRWLCDAGLGVADLATPAVGVFLVARRAAYRELLTAKALVPLLGYLRGLGVVPQPESPAPQSVVAVLLERYRCWLLTERGVGVKVARGYVDLVRPFVAAHAVSGEAGLRELAPVMSRRS